MYVFDKLYSSENYYYKYNKHRNQELFGTETVLPFWIADMDFKIADPITEQLNQIVSRGIYAYELPPLDYYEVMANWFNKRHQFDLNPHYFLAVPGILTGMAFLIETFSEKGDAILIQTPVYHQFQSTIEKNERIAVCNSLKIHDNRYKIDFEGLEFQFKSQRIKMMILCNPHNPVGRVWTDEEIKRIVDLIQQYQVLLVSDEVHSEIIFGNRKFNSLTQYHLPNIVTILGSAGKTFGLQSIATGVFYVHYHELRTHLKKRIEALHLTHGNAFSRYAAYAAYKHGEEWLDQMLEYVEHNYQWIQNFIETELPMVKLLPLEGTYLIWLDFRSLTLSKKDLEELLFKNARIGFAPGDWFGEEGLGFMRMTIACPLSILQKAFFQLKKSITKS